MARSSTSLISLALCLAVLACQAHQALAARQLKHSLTSEAGRALKQVGDAFTRWGGGTNGYLDDGSRTAVSAYARVVRREQQSQGYGQRPAGACARKAGRPAPRAAGDMGCVQGWGGGQQRSGPGARTRAASLAIPRPPTPPRARRGPSACSAPAP
ncbi:hypothetical protein MNEG_14388 [Monoraphidium neglectum]|uniref:Uncharacterized protein n=1 Tax=Monoraphidium neglectum TaxID=145388 RepID=A0A0D2KCK8_9CHLO|nr:hypothetical protein MNEG_14388 [Monoraphidium neglectum]KIY93573.1 hypothetical protein MNEG_14388 [Monoraphidium neglectum]|eukprot:XP_013892593.1 hypothetical protein MNEG_14388 [Monoraphidium neglectum]